MRDLADSGSGRWTERREIASDGAIGRPRENSNAYWGAPVALFGAGVAVGAAGCDPFTEPCLAFFLVVPEPLSVAPPTVALALAAEPTLADGSVVDWAGQIGRAHV